MVNEVREIVEYVDIVMSDGGRCWPCPEMGGCENGQVG